MIAKINDTRCTRASPVGQSVSLSGLAGHTSAITDARTVAQHIERRPWQPSGIDDDPLSQLLAELLAAHDRLRLSRESR